MFLRKNFLYVYFPGSSYIVFFPVKELNTWDQENNCLVDNMSNRDSLAPDLAPDHPHGPHHDRADVCLRHPTHPPRHAGADVAVRKISEIQFNKYLWRK